MVVNYTFTIKAMFGNTAQTLMDALEGVDRICPLRKDDKRIVVKTDVKSTVDAVKRAIRTKVGFGAVMVVEDINGKFLEGWYLDSCVRWGRIPKFCAKDFGVWEDVYESFADETGKDVSIEDKNRKNEPVHVYESFADEEGKEVTLAELGDMICDDEVIAKKTERIRKTYDAAKFARMKRSLPNVVIGAVMSGKRCMANVLRPTGYIMIDIDHIVSNQYYIFKVLETLPYVRMMWASVSGHGLHVVCKWRGWSDDGFIAEYSECYRRLSGEISALLSNKGFDSSSYEIDPACKDISRCCFISCGNMSGLNESYYSNDKCEEYIYSQSPLEGTDTAEVSCSGGAKSANRPKTENVAPVASGGDDDDIEVYDVEVVSAAPITGVEPGDIDAWEQAEKSLHDDFMRDLKDIYAKAMKLKVMHDAIENAKAQRQAV